MSEKESKDASQVEMVVVEEEAVTGNPEGEGDACAIPGAERADAQQAGIEESGDGKSVSAPDAASPVPEKELPINKCFICGSLKPGEEVWQCTLCMQKFCVNHLEPRRHFCYEGQSP
jgi:hypothetical protein